MKLDLPSDRAASAGLIRFHDHEPAPDDFRAALIAGLSGEAKAIPCRFLYDLSGSLLFDRICELPEYYPTRTEIGILGAGWFLKATKAPEEPEEQGKSAS